MNESKYPHNIREGAEVYVDMDFANGGYKATVVRVGRLIAHIKVDDTDSWDIMVNRLTPITDERVLCAAIWYKDVKTSKLPLTGAKEGVVLCGHRHPDVIQQLFALTGLRTVTFGENAAGEHEQGFITNKRRFVDRKEAAILAFVGGQIKERKRTLYSEDIY